MQLRSLILSASAFVVLITGQTVAQSSLAIRKTNYTVAEIKEWAQKNKDQRWHGWLLYQGSDATQHHFISRYMDEWVWFKIPRKDIQLKEEKPLSKQTSSTPLGYYYVDPLQNFIKVKEY